MALARSAGIFCLGVGDLGFELRLLGLGRRDAPRELRGFGAGVVEPLLRQRQRITAGLAGVVGRVRGGRAEGDGGGEEDESSGTAEHGAPGCRRPEGPA